MPLLAIRLWVHWTSKWVLLIEWLGQCLLTSPDIVIEQNLSVRSFTPMRRPGSNSRSSVAIYFTSSELVRDNIQYYNFLVNIFAPALIYIEYIASICTWGTTSAPPLNILLSERMCQWFCLWGLMQFGAEDVLFSFYFWYRYRWGYCSSTNSVIDWNSSAPTG